MQYTLNWLEEKEWEGKKFLSVRVKPLDGPEFEATMWGDKWGDRLTQITPGMQIEANPWQNPKNGKWSLYPPDPKKPQGGAFGASRTASIAKAQERKETSIQKSQERRDISVKVSATMRDAVQLAMAEGKPTIETIEKWRTWLWTNFDKEDKDFPPFD